MKTTWRDKSTILMAFAAVFLCGYGIGHIVRERQMAGALPASHHAPTPAWEQETLSLLRESLNLRPEQVPQVESELSSTAQAIHRSHQDVLLDYHRHLNALYERLIRILDDEQASRLRAEKKALERQIENLSNP